MEPIFNIIINQKDTANGFTQKDINSFVRKLDEEVDIHINGMGAEISTAIVLAHEIIAASEMTVFQITQIETLKKYTQLIIVLSVLPLKQSHFGYKKHTFQLPPNQTQKVEESKNQSKLLNQSTTSASLQQTQYQYEAYSDDEEQKRPRNSSSKRPNNVQDQFLPKGKSDNQRSVRGERSDFDNKSTRESNRNYNSNNSTQKPLYNKRQYSDDDFNKGDIYNQKSIQNPRTGQRDTQINKVKRSQSVGGRENIEKFKESQNNTRSGSRVGNPPQNFKNRTNERISSNTYENKGDNYQPQHYVNENENQSSRNNRSGASDRQEEEDYRKTPYNNRANISHNKNAGGPKDISSYQRKKQEEIDEEGVYQFNQSIRSRPRKNSADQGQKNFRKSEYNGPRRGGTRKDNI